MLTGWEWQEPKVQSFQGVGWQGLDAHFPRVRSGEQEPSSAPNWLGVTHRAGAHFPLVGSDDQGRGPVPTGWEWRSGSGAGPNWLGVALRADAHFQLVGSGAQGRGLVPTGWEWRGGSPVTSWRTIAACGGGGDTCAKGLGGGH